MSADAARHLQRVLDTRTVDAAAAAWIVAGLAAWLRPGADLQLPACLGLPRSAKGGRIALRNSWLRSAAAELDGGPWEKAMALQREVRRFATSRLRRWLSTGIPPGASAVEIGIFNAFAVGARMPNSAQIFWRVLSDSPGATKQVTQEKFGMDVPA